MRGVILAAGKGSRLNGTAGDKPKCLVTVGGVTLIERQIRMLRRAGIDDIAAVVGCQADAVRAECGRTITYVENAEFADTNSLYSLWMARALLSEGAVILNCDVLFHPVLIEDLLASPFDAALLVAYRNAGEPRFGDEEMKVQVRAGRVVDMAKTLAPENADGENLGVVKFGPSSAPALATILERIVAAGGVRDWAPRAFREFAQDRPLFAIGTRGYPWIEIDFPDDYQRAVREVLPAIERMRPHARRIDTGGRIDAA
ncbi:MAG: NTP transferase domain-containing protein [Vicinamibacterales bacterium]